jgi:hypothetical protein
MLSVVSRPLEGRDLALFIAITLGIAALAFVNLGLGEIESWDEALYVVRAQAIEHYGCWLDQTQYALGGLYSSTHPPLGIWAITIIREVFGTSTFATRLPSALAYLSSIVALYLLLRSSLSWQASTIGAASLATAQTYVHYAHRAQLDAMLIAWTLISLCLFVRSRSRDDFLTAVMAGVAFGFALLTKFGFGLLLLPFVLVYTLRTRDVKRLIVFSLTGVLIALPWYLWMHFKYPDFGLHAERLIASAYYDSLTIKSWYYYLNQSIINVPLIVPSLIALVLTRKTLRRDASPLLLPAVVWYGGTLLVLEIMAAKMSHFGVMLFPPLALIVAVAAKGLHENGWKLLLVILAALVSLWWSLSEQLRLIVTGRMRLSLLIIPQPLILVLLAILVCILIWQSRNHHFRTQEILPSIALILLSFQLSRMLSYSPDMSDNGARNIIGVLKGIGADSVTVITGHAPHEHLLPQLRYYAAEVGVSSSSWIIDTSWDNLDHQDAVIINGKPDRFAHPQDKYATTINAVMDSASKHYANRLRARSYELFYN